MKLKIKRIENKSGAGAEAVWLQILADCNLTGHILADTTFDDTHKTNLVRHTYWFPERAAKKGEWIVFYNGVWNDEGDTATLIEIGSSATFPVPTKP